jgi:small subunit ribosomal protein S6
MLFIVHPNYEQDQMDPIINAVKKEITDRNGKVLKVDNWGKRKLAYLINKQRYGTYVLMYFEADPQIIKDISEWMEINAQILHQMIVRLENEPELNEISENPDAIGGSAYDKKEASSGQKKIAVDDKNESDKDDSDDNTDENEEE